MSPHNDPPPDPASPDLGLAPRERQREKHGWLGRAWARRRGLWRSAQRPHAAPSPDDVGYRILEVGPGEPAGAVRARLQQEPPGVIVLRIAHRNRLLATGVSMEVLSRHARDFQQQLIVESRRPALRRLAAEHGLLAVGSVHGRRMAGARLLPRSVRLGPVTAPLVGVRLLTRMLMGGIMVTAVGAALLTLLPSATVTLLPTLETVTLPLALRAEVVEGGETPQAGFLPARRLSTEVTVTSSAPTSGSAAAPDRFASGEVQFTNQGAPSLTLPGGTIVTTIDGRAFVTQQDALVPAGAGQAVTVPVVAQSGGVGGNVPAGAVAVAPEPYAGQVRVSNPAGFSGGADREVPGVSTEDLARLRRTLERLLVDHGVEQLVAEQGAAFALDPGSARVVVLEETATPPLGDPGAEVEMTIRAIVSAAGVPWESLRLAAARTLREQRGSGFQILTDTFAITRVDRAAFDPETDSLTFDIIMSGTITAPLDRAAISRQVRWRSPGEAERRLDGALDLRAPADVSLRPGWLPRISPFGFRTTVHVDTAPAVLPSTPTPGEAGN